MLQGLYHQVAPFRVSKHPSKFLIFYEQPYLDGGNSALVNRVLVETNVEASKTLFFKRHFRASQIALTEARFLKHDLHFHGYVGKCTVFIPFSGDRLRDLGKCSCSNQFWKRILLALEASWFRHLAWLGRQKMGAF